MTCEIPKSFRSLLHCSYSAIKKLIAGHSEAGFMFFLSIACPCCVNKTAVCFVVRFLVESWFLLNFPPLVLGIKL